LNATDIRGAERITTYEDSVLGSPAMQRFTVFSDDDNISSWVVLAELLESRIG